MNTKFLALSWSTSRGHETFGYIIVRLDDTQTDKRYRAMGGGYDMTGTVFGQWLQENHQEALKAGNVTQLYGARLRADGSVSLDGACGLECMIRIAEAVGLEVKHLNNRKGHTNGFLVGPKA